MNVDTPTKMNSRKPSQQKRNTHRSLLTSLFPVSPSPSRLSSETEYDSNKKPEEINVADIPSCKKGSRNSNSHDIMIIDDGDDEVTSTMGGRRSSLPSRPQYSSSSLPPPSLSVLSSSTAPTSTTVIPAPRSCGTTPRSSLSPTRDLNNFSKTSREFLSKTSKCLTEVQKMKEIESQKSNNPFKKKTESDSDEDFELPTKRKQKNHPSYSQNASLLTAKSFYKSTSAPVDIQRYPLRNFSRPKVISKTTSQSRLRQKSQELEGTVENPMCIDEISEEVKVSRKPRTKLLRPGPSLSTMEDYGTVTLRAKQAKFGTVTCTANEVKIEENEIFIHSDAFKKRKVHVNYSDMLELNTNVHHGPPYLMYAELTATSCSRLSTLLNSLLKCSSPPLGGKDNYVILHLEEGIKDGISAGQFEENVKKVKKHRQGMSESEIEHCLQELTEKDDSFESEDPLGKDFTRYPKRKPKLSLPLQKELSVTISDNVLSPAKTERSLASLPAGPMISEADQDPLLTRLELSSPVLRRRNKRTTQVTITDDTPEPDSSLYPEDANILSYTFQNVKGPPQFTITGHDLNSLAPECYLNDQIINFFLRYYWERLEEDMKESVHVFSTFFYSRLVNTSRDDPNLETPDRLHYRVQSWTKSVNIFDKKYVLVPVCYRSHWFIGILCNIGEYDPTEPTKTPKPKTVQRKRRKPLSTSRRTKKKSPRKGKEEEDEELLQQYVQIKQGEDNPMVQETGREEKGVEPVEDVKDDSSDRVSVMSIGDDAKEEPLPEDMEWVEEGGGVSGSCLKDAEASEYSKKDPVILDEPISAIGRGLPEDNSANDTVSLLSPEDTGSLVSPGDSGSLVITEDGSMMVVSSSQEDCTTVTETRDSSTLGSCLVVLDSMLVKRRGVGNNLKKYLTQEFRRKFPSQPDKDFTNLPVLWPEVPAQTNGFDCGVFMLTYVENFFKLVQENQRLPVGGEWIGNQEMKMRRTELKNKILELSNHKSALSSDP